MKNPGVQKIMVQIYFLIFASFLLTACGSISPFPPTQMPCKPASLGRLDLQNLPGLRWQSYHQNDGLPADSVTSIGIDTDGGVWVGTGRGVAYYDGADWSKYTDRDGLLSNLTMSIVVDPRGTAWFGSDLGISRFDGDTWTHFTEEDGLPTGYIHVLSIDERERVWAGIVGAGSDWAFGNGAARLDDNNSADKEDDLWQIYLPTRQRMAGDIVSAMIDLGSAGIWFGVTPEGTVRANSGGGGIWRLTGSNTLDPNDDQWEVKDMRDGVISNTISSFARASDGGLWVGTLNGLIFLTPEAVQNFSFDDPICYTNISGLPSDRILSLAVDDNRIWIGTDAGLVLMQNGWITSITKSDGLADNYIRAIAIAPDGAVWVATPFGISVGR